MSTLNTSDHCFDSSELLDEHVVPSIVLYVSFVHLQQSSNCDNVRNAIRSSREAQFCALLIPQTHQTVQLGKVALGLFLLQLCIGDQRKNTRLIITVMEHVRLFYFNSTPFPEF